MLAPGEARAPARVRAPKVRDARRENRNVGDVRSVKTAVDNQRLSDARLIHGAIMIVAWLFLSPWASLLARYGRDFDSWWFRAHRNAQCVAIALTAFSAYIITTARGWEKPWGPHGKYGLLVIALGFAQGYMGFIRKTLPRINFQRWHRTLGVATTVLAIRNCIIGAGMIQLFESHDVTSPASGFPRVVNLCVFVLAITTGVVAVPSLRGCNWPFWSRERKLISAIRRCWKKASRSSTRPPTSREATGPSTLLIRKETYWKSTPKSEAIHTMQETAQFLRFLAAAFGF